MTENATFLKKHQLARSLLAADESFEEAPFWANRGRRSTDGNLQNSNIHVKGENLNELGNDRLRRLESSLENLPFWANRGKKLKNSGEEFPFWANRGKRVKSYTEEFPFWANRGKRLKSSAEELPFWANRGKRNLGGSDEELPFWANRGKRSASDWKDSQGKRAFSEEEFPFWANRGRRNHLSDESIEDEPFWANRGRRNAQESANVFPSVKLYADEPGWVILDQREPLNQQGNKRFWGFFENAKNNERNVAKGINSEEDIPFWGGRGKKNNQDSGFKQVSSTSFFN